MQLDVEVVAAPAALDAALSTDVDRLGASSAEAQRLPRAITSAALFAAPAAVNERQKLFVARDRGSGEALGFVKSGVKHLFYLDRSGRYSELDPVCVLDFYVVGERQRRGVGRALFGALLEAEKGVQPAQLAYDRPSPLLFAFLAKHAGLTDFFPQPNNFVVFDAYFALHHAANVPSETGKR